MIPKEHFDEILKRMNECMTIPTGLFGRLNAFECQINEKYNNDWREVSEIRSLNDQFLALIYPID